jgi:hypothetical protein
LRREPDKQSDSLLSLILTWNRDNKQLRKSFSPKKTVCLASKISPKITLLNKLLSKRTIQAYKYGFTMQFSWNFNNFAEFADILFDSDLVLC